MMPSRIKCAVSKLFNWVFAIPLLDATMPGGKLNNEPEIWAEVWKSNETFCLFCAKATCKTNGNCSLGLEDLQTSNFKTGPNLFQVWETRATHTFLAFLFQIWRLMFQQQCKADLILGPRRCQERRGGNIRWRLRQTRVPPGACVLDTL